VRKEEKWQLTRGEGNSFYHGLTASTGRPTKTDHQPGFLMNTKKWNREIGRGKKRWRPVS